MWWCTGNSSFEIVLINETNDFTNNNVIQGRGSALCFAGTQNVTFHGITYIEGNFGCALTADFRNNGTSIDSDRRTGTEIFFFGETYFFKLTIHTLMVEHYVLGLAISLY